MSENRYIFAQIYFVFMMVFSGKIAHKDKGSCSFWLNNGSFTTLTEYMAGNCKSPGEFYPETY